MKKEFIMPSLEMKKFSKVLVMDGSALPDEPIESNGDRARKLLNGKDGIDGVVTITL